MSTQKSSKTIRQLKERAAEIRRQGKVSIPRSLELAAREHGFSDFETARLEIGARRAASTSEAIDLPRESEDSETPI
ncbi:MAG: glyoxalase superfamily protein [Oligoflexus sp.]|jgi:hypothetical protein